MTLVSDDSTAVSASDGSCLSSVDVAVDSVAPHRQEWKNLPAREKSGLIVRCISNLKKYHTQYEEAGLKRRGYHLSDDKKNSADEVAACETEKAMIPLVTSIHLAFWLTSLKRTFDTIADTGEFPKPVAVALNSDKTVRLNVSPPDNFTWIASGLATLELHVENPKIGEELEKQQPNIIAALSGRRLGTAPNEQADSQNTNVSEGESRSELTSSEIPLVKNLQHNASDFFAVTGGEVVAVLGAGNFDCPVDILTAMFIGNNVAVYKFSPLSESLAASFMQIFSPLVERGFLAFTSGDAKECSKLLHHPEVAKWCMTGGTRTANSILFGSPESPFEGRQPGTVTLEELDEKLKLRKPATIELGNCSPYIIAPGHWTDRELVRHARHLVLGMLMNGGHICARPQIVVTCKNWPQRQEFLAQVRRGMRDSKTVGNFYPNGIANLERCKEKLVKEGHDLDQITLKSGSIVFADSVNQTSSILTEEAFCCVAAEVPLDTLPTISEFLPTAVKFANAQAYGALAATIIAKTVTLDDNTILEDAILKLKYGSVGINISGVLSICYPQLVWGGCQDGVDATHLQSGIGFFGNCYGFRHPRKSVLRSSFTSPVPMLQVIPQGREIPQFQKLFGRLTRGFCNQALSSGIGLLDYVGIGSVLVLNL